MKPSVKIIACMLFVIALLTDSCISTRVTVNKSAGPENKLIGVWKAAESVNAQFPTVADAYMVFTKKYRFVVGSNASNRQELPENPTDSQLVAAWAPVWAFAWTYEVKENTIITRLLFAKNPNWKPGEESSYPLKFDGDDLMWTFMAGNGEIVTQRYKRLE